MQKENQDALQVGEFVMSPKFVRGRLVETATESIVRIGMGNEIDLERAESVYKVVSVKPRRASSGGDLVLAQRMISPTEEGDEIIEFIYGGTSQRAVSADDLYSQVEDDDEITFTLE